MFLYFYISFVQCKKHEKHPWKSVAIQPATLLKVAPHPPTPPPPPWVFFAFFKFYKWCEITQGIIHGTDFSI